MTLDFDAGCHVNYRQLKGNGETSLHASQRVPETATSMNWSDLG